MFGIYLGIYNTTHFNNVHTTHLNIDATVITDGRYGNGTTEVYLSSQYCRQKYNNIKYCSLNIGNQCNSFGCQYNRIGLKCHGKLL